MIQATKILVARNSKTGAFREYELHSNCIDITQTSIKDAIFKSLNQKYGENFDTLSFKEV